MKEIDLLIKATIQFLGERFPIEEVEEDVVVAGAYTYNNEILLGVATEALLNSACLCAETGPICEAQKLKAKIIATVCIIREKPTSAIKFVAPCGLCQERLLFFGKEMQVVIPQQDPTKWTTCTLEQLQPNHWHKAFE